MKGIRLLLLALMAFVAGSMNAKVKVRQTPAYLFGYALSPVDSVVYLTSIQRVDTVYMEKKTKMLMGRSLYSDQLQQYLENSMGVRGAICAVFFNSKQEQLEKKLQRVVKRAKKNPDYRITYLGTEALAFKSVPWEEEKTPVKAPKEKHTKKKAKK